MSSIYDTIAMQVIQCLHCGAAPGTGCRNTRGKISAGCHWQRKDQVQRVWRKDHETEYQGMVRGQEYGMSSCGE